jgi:hypothetical protein
LRVPTSSTTRGWRLGFVNLAGFVLAGFALAGLRALRDLAIGFFFTLRLAMRRILDPKKFAVECDLYARLATFSRWSIWPSSCACSTSL